MSVEEKNVEILRTFVTRFNKGEPIPELVAEYAAPSFLRHDLAGAFADVHGQSGVNEFLRAWTTALADMRLDIVDIFGSGDRVCMHFIGSGIHRGQLLGAPATGKKLQWHGINIYRLANGKIAETWQLGDMLGILRQMGVVSVAGQESQP